MKGVSQKRFRLLFFKIVALQLHASASVASVEQGPPGRKPCVSCDTLTWASATAVTPWWQRRWSGLFQSVSLQLREQVALPSGGDLVRCPICRICGWSGVQTRESRELLSWRSWFKAAGALSCWSSTVWTTFQGDWKWHCPAPAARRWRSYCPFTVSPFRKASKWNLICIPPPPTKIPTHHWPTLAFSRCGHCVFLLHACVCMCVCTQTGKLLFYKDCSWDRERQRQTDRPRQRRRRRTRKYEQGNMYI